jgi:hypothetical protein
MALMMEVARTSETLVNFYQSTRRYNPEDSHLRKHSYFALRDVTQKQISVCLHCCYPFRSLVKLADMRCRRGTVWNNERGWNVLYCLRTCPGMRTTIRVHSKPTVCSKPI